MAIISSPGTSAVDEQDGQGRVVNVSSGWRNFFTQVFTICNALTMSGITANRPTVGLWRGRFFWDSTLARPIWYSGAIWVFADGTPA